MGNNDWLTTTCFLQNNAIYASIDQIKIVQKIRGNSEKLKPKISDKELIQRYQDIVKERDEGGGREGGNEVVGILTTKSKRGNDKANTKEQ
jgi:hypothetical protein